MGDDRGNARIQNLEYWRLHVRRHCTERKFEQHIRAAIEPDAGAGLADFLKYLVTVPDFAARNYFDACAARAHHHRDLLTNSLAVRRLVMAIEHMRRSHDGRNPISGCDPTHSDRFLK